MTNWLKKFFVPHEGNDYRSHIFREVSVLSFLFVAIITFALGEIDRAVITKSNWLAAVYSSVLVDMANSDRVAYSLGGLKTNPVLENAALMKAKDMVTKGYFAHFSPDGKAPWDWIKLAGYKYEYAGENLAIDFTDSGDVNAAWMNSPSHRANILNQHYTEIGIATQKGIYQGRETTFVVEMFANPLPSIVKSRARIAPTKSAAAVALAGSFISNPKYIVEGVYAILSLIILIGLFALTRVELRKHHYMHIAYGFLLIAIFASLGFMYQSAIFTKAIVLGTGL
ncbi:MAG: CAP domain-containing protein [Patescibacteria group bacterium]